jgi:transcriptional regulator of acetoin/glycerol metabolism
MGDNWIRVTELARQLGVSDRTIYKHLQRVEQDLEGHIQRHGVKGTWLDDTAQAAIKSRVVPALPPVVVSDSALASENEQLKAELINLQRKVIEMQETAVQQREQLALATAQQQLLQAAQQAAAEKEAQLQVETEARQAAEQRAAQATAETEQLREQLDMERGRKLSWGEAWKRIRGKN